MNQIAIIGEALQEPTIKELQVNVIIDKLKVLIMLIFSLIGNKCEFEDLNFMSGAFCGILKDRFGSLTIGEVAISLDKGVKGDYGDYYGLNTMTFLKWTQSYKESSAREKALEEGQRKLLPIAVSLTQEELDMKMRNDAYIDYKIFADFGKFHCVPSTYDLLSKLGILSISEEEKKVFVERARSRLIEQNKAAQFKTNNEWDFKKLTSDISKINSISESGELLIIDEAKTMILEEYFLKVKTENIDLKSLIFSK